jgi:hypothetical protein
MTPTPTGRGRPADARLVVLGVAAAARALEVRLLGNLLRLLVLRVLRAHGLAGVAHVPAAGAVGRVEPRPLAARGPASATCGRTHSSS